MSVNKNEKQEVSNVINFAFERMNLINGDLFIRFKSPIDII